MVIAAAQEEFCRCRDFRHTLQQFRYTARKLFVLRKGITIRRIGKEKIYIASELAGRAKNFFVRIDLVRSPRIALSGFKGTG